MIEQDLDKLAWECWLAYQENLKECQEKGQDISAPHNVIFTLEIGEEE